MTQSADPAATAAAKNGARSLLAVIRRNQYLLGGAVDRRVPCALAGGQHERAADHPAGAGERHRRLHPAHRLGRTGPRHACQTLWPFAIGLVVAFVIGTALGLLLGIFRPAARILDPYIFVFWSIPNIAWLPLFIAWFGVGNLTLIIFVFVSAVFPQMLTVEAGAKEADSFLVEVARSLGGTQARNPAHRRAARRRCPTFSPACASRSAARSSASSSANC